MLVGAVVSVPYYAYYQLTNWVVVGAALVTAWQAHKQGSAWITWEFAFVAVIFNPIAPLYFSAGVWEIADLVAIVLFVLSFYFVRNK
jgi:hypothetical protein